MSICFLALLLLCLLPHCLGLVQKHLSPSNCLMLVPQVWGHQLLNFSKIPILKPCTSPLLHPRHIHISFMISLVGSVVNPVKSCTTSGHSFLWQEFYCFGLDGFFYNNNGIFNGVILPDFHDAVYIGVLFHCAGNPFHQAPCVMSLKDP